jgi:hypothetical protein
MLKMMRLFTATIIAMLLSCICFAQENVEKAPIKEFKTWLGYRYTYQAKPLTKWGDFYSIMKNTPEAVTQLNKARTNNAIAAGLGAVGGFLVGWPLGQALVRVQKPNWVLAAAGGGLVVIGAGFGIGSGKQLKKGVDIYNQGIALIDDTLDSFTIAFSANSINIKVRL